MNGHKAAIAGYLGVFFFIITTILAGFLFPGYSHTAQLISQSYASGTEFGIYLRFLGFMPAGIFLAAFAYLTIKTLQVSGSGKWGLYGLGIFYGIGTIIVSFFPCDTGCNPELIDPTLSQLIHNLTGLLTYLIVPISLILIGFNANKWPDGKKLSYSGIICGMTAMIFVGILSSNMESENVGLYQRIIEGSILLWIIFCSFYLKKRSLHYNSKK